MLSEFQVGVKAYDVDWFVKYGLTYREAAQILHDWGVTFVLAQNRYLPMPDSAVESQVGADLADRYESYDDHQFRDALGREGIEYWATVCMFFDPGALAADGSLRPIGSDGRRMQRLGWYEGIAPTMKGYVAEKLQDLKLATHELDPEGIFLSFTRWPGFWELWMPPNHRQDFVEYSYDAYTLDRFVGETGVNLQTRNANKAAAWIEANAREEWTAWKCRVVVEVVSQVRTACREIKPDLEIMLNTLPFGREGFDGAQEKVFGQSVEALSDIVDRFEVMTYHQILKRPVSWIPTMGAEVKERSGRSTVCTIQAKPHYLDGMYARAGRSPTIDEQEFADAVQVVEAADLDGVVVFVWSDLLEDVLEHSNMQRVDALRAAVERRQARLSGQAGG